MILDGYVKQLLLYGKKYLGLDPRDEVYARNRVMEMLGMVSYTETETGEVPDLPDTILQAIFKCLEDEGKSFDRAVLGEKLMDAVMPRPSEHEKIFESKYEISPKAATEWAYSFAVKSDYVKKSAIDKNLKWMADDGTIEITINLSKPEKNNKDLQKQLSVASTDYPKCTICRENEGYERAGFSRRNMRTLSLTLSGEQWFWQYSPYAYFNEHGIAISCKHYPMALNRGTVEKLFDFVELFPHYFIGNNAPLPRVGGSILMHNHYQGGGYVLPMQRAKYRLPLRSEKYSRVTVGVLDWYNTALRLESDNREELTALAEEIFSVWETYKDESVDILPVTNNESHNTASCIARKTETGYILDMILRNNRTDERYPDGIFHAHGEYHHIKSESIGLIEAMGLFILPARLKRQLAQIEQYLTGEAQYNEHALADDMKIFAPMIMRMTGGNAPHYTKSEAQAALKAEVESVCKNILGNTAVFKRDRAGEDALKKFLGKAGLIIG